MIVQRVQSSPRKRQHRRGSAYVAVVGAATLAATLAVAAARVTRVEARSENASADATDAQTACTSAIEWMRYRINSDPNWRANAGSDGAWTAAINIGAAAVSVVVTDPADNDLANDPHQGVTITATATRGAAKQALRVRLDAVPVPIDAIGRAMHVGGQLRVRGGKKLNAGNATISTNGSLYNEGTIVGNVIAGLSLFTGTIQGETAIPTLMPTPMPDANVAAMYTQIGTAISAGSSIDKRALGPGYNPWGAANADGVYIWNGGSNDLVLKDSRIVGTLVVTLAAGKKLSIENDISMMPGRPDFPALIVIGGEVLIKHEAGTFAESGIGVNLNPTGVPSADGSTDSDQTDSYTSEIQGLVHVKGSIRFEKDGPVRGAVICESTATSAAVDVTESMSITYMPSLFTTPLRGYTKRVDMVLQRGSWERVVEEE